ncbi:MFS transporter [Poseidonocella sp. HB161398]|uniref:MFS transporter n=1 Tax=Poseidonocella sp. HB161398 TaxID=2320855 RepID=UPI001109F40F|nr:MFS transporter [Poseidonocella sp. HB161398]
MTAAAPAAATAAPPKPAAPAVLDARTAAALTGVLIAAMLSGLNSRSGSLALSDIEGAIGQGIDNGSWISTLYSAGELVAMPFAGWMAITFSVRRFFLAMLAVTALIAAAMPLLSDLRLILVLRALQGLTAGALIPLLMMMALRFLPPPIRLHGLALYAMTATFTPNVAFWAVGHWADRAADLRWVSWQLLPGAALCAGLVGWGLPKEPVNWKRFDSFNWVAFLAGVPGLFLLAVGLGQGNRLDWFHSPLVATCLAGGGIFLAVYVLAECLHPAPFIKFSLMGRRNLYIGFTIFFLLLVVLYSGASLPAAFLAGVQGYRSLQSAPVGLAIGLPQLVAGFAVALLLYQRWVDARAVMALGLVLVGTACLLASGLDTGWTWRQFLPAQALQALGQPMAVVPLLFLSTSVVQPMEGPYIAGFVNMLRGLGTLAGVAAMGRFSTLREHFHSDVLTGHAAAMAGHLPGGFDADSVATAIDAQAAALSAADTYRLLGWTALAMVPLCAFFTHVPAPLIPPRR